MAKRATPQKPRVLKRTTGSAANPAEAKKRADGEGSNAADLEAFHIHVGEIKRAQAVVVAARKVLKEKRRAASDAGLQLGHLDLVLKMSEEEPETVQASVSTIATYAHWMGLAPGFQADLFKDTAPTKDAMEAAEHEGYVEGLEGKTADGERYDAGNEYGQARLKGWNRGQDVYRDRIKPIPEATTEGPATTQ